jgi:hypothetical protein
MTARTSKRSRTGRGTRGVGDLRAKADRAAAVKGGIIIHARTSATGADTPGATQGVIAIIRPEGGA